MTHTASNTDTVLSSSFITNPATGDTLYELKHTTKSELETVIATAESAFKKWSEIPPVKRARVMFSFLELMNQNRDLLAKTITDEHGKTLDDAAGEVQRGIEVIEFACGMPHLMKGEFTENVSTGIDSYAVRQPLGVVAGITPFNFPIMIPLWMFPVAVAAGNTFILKPSEVDPGVSNIMMDLFLKAGAPEGVLQVVHGGKDVVTTLIEHPSIQAVSFVGSTPVAEHVHKTASAHGKRVQALGGAKNHMVIMPDAPMDQVVESLMGAAYGSAGERCMAVSVAVPVGKETADKLIEALSKRIQELKIGAGTEKGIEMGPLISAQHLEKVKGYVEIGIQEGATLILDGRHYKSKTGKGHFMGGCLFDNVKTDMKIYQEEIFGPVLSVVRADDVGEAIKIINDHPFGNGVAIFTKDGGAARTFAHLIQVGMIGINVPIPVPMAFHSFGGWKRSLFGDVHMHGMEGVRFFTRYKAITTRWPKNVTAEFSMPTAK